MKLVSISCIADEEDIIESFVRINSTFIDAFIFIDDSQDATGEILESLKAEGHVIHRLFRQKSEPYVQDQVVNGAIRYLLDSQIKFDFIFFLDSDEFPVFKSKSHAQAVMNSVPCDAVSVYRWETYVPISVDFECESADSFQKHFRRRIPEGLLFEKVVVPKALAPEAYVTVGSHNAYRIQGNQLHPLPKFQLPISLAHFPVRSPQQILWKNLFAVGSLLRKSERVKGEGWHVYDVLRQLVSCDFKISGELLRKIAHDYANKDGQHSVTGDAPLWMTSYELKYTGVRDKRVAEKMAKLLVNSWAQPLNVAAINELESYMKHVTIKDE
jgi:hypothetical protein